MILPDEEPASPTKGTAALAQPSQPEQEVAPPPSYPGHEPWGAYSQQPQQAQSSQQAQPQQQSLPPQPRLQPQPQYYGAAGPSAYGPIPPQSLPPFKRGPPARGRFLRAFCIALFVWVLGAIVVQSLFEAATYVGRRNRDYPEWRSAVPLPSDGNQTRCLKGYDSGWRRDGSRMLASFDLPLTADVLYVFSRGVRSAGNIVITQDERIHDVESVHVDVAAVHSTPAYLNAVSVCSLERKPGESGIGIFTPRTYPVLSQLPTLDFEITVRFPKTVDGAPLRIPAFDTDLRLFSHQVSELAGKVFFEDFRLKSTNSRIGVQSLNASMVTIRTSNDELTGKFEAENIGLVTTNDYIEAQVTLRGDTKGNRSEAIIETSNASIIGNVRLVSTSASATGGIFHVASKTNNGRLSLAFDSAPVDSILSLDARTSNAPAGVMLHPTFEGNLKLTTSNADIRLQFDEQELDPAGRGRKRKVHYSAKSRTGTILWDGEHMGSVELRSSNGPVKLIA